MNTSNVASDFVTLGFIAGEYGPAPHPIKQLVSYERGFGVAAGDSQVASMNVNLGGLARYDEDGNAVLYPGDNAMLLDLPTALVVNFTLTGCQVILVSGQEAESGMRKIRHGKKEKGLERQSMA
jgi:beta-D-xylosidase 4